MFIPAHTMLEQSQVQLSVYKHRFTNNSLEFLVLINSIGITPKAFLQ